MGKKRKRSNSSESQNQKDSNDQTNDVSTRPNQVKPITNSAANTQVMDPRNSIVQGILDETLSLSENLHYRSQDDNVPHCIDTPSTEALSESDPDDDNTSCGSSGRKEFIDLILSAVALEDLGSARKRGRTNEQQLLSGGVRRSTRHSGPDCTNELCATCMGSRYSIGGAQFQILQPVDGFNSGASFNRRHNAANARGTRKLTVEQRIQASGMDTRTKELLLSAESSLCVKNQQWVEELLSIPFGKYASVRTNKRSPHKPLEKLMNCMNEKVFGMTRVKEEILNFASQICSNPDSKPRVLGLCSRAGVGKCLAKGTRVWLASGSLVPVEEVAIGDILMGDDQTPRQVIELSNGTNMLYKVTNSTGFEYTVTANHILTLQQIQEVNIVYDDTGMTFFWLQGSKFLKSHLLKTDLFMGRGTGLASNSGTSKDELDERALAYWRLEIAKKRNVMSSFKPRVIDIDLEVFRKLSKGFQSLFSNFTLPHIEKFTKPRNQVAYTKAKNNDHWFGVGHQYSQIQDCRVGKGVRNAGKMFQILMQQDYSSRFEFCVGFVFGTGLHKTASGLPGKMLYEWIKPPGDPSFYWFEQVCLSVGLTCQLVTQAGGNANPGTREETVLVRIEANTPSSTNCIKSGSTNPHAVRIEPVGEGEFFGFELSGNGRFLLADLTVTHNTSIVQSLETGLERSLQSINLNGMKDSSHLLGFDYTYSGAKHGAILDAVIRAQIMNPILFFDELDKVSDSNEGHEVVSVLMNLTDPISNEAFADKYFHQVFFDLSRCIMIFAFNDESAIHPVLKDRMHIIHIPVPTSQEKIQIAHQFLLPQLCTNIGLKPLSVVFQDDVLAFILRNYCKDDEGVRPLKRCLESILLRLNTLQMLAKSTVKLSYDLKAQFPITLKPEHVTKLLAGTSDQTAFGAHMSMYS